jgi:hypothetical protein
MTHTAPLTLLSVHQTEQLDVTMEVDLPESILLGLHRRYLRERALSLFWQTVGFHGWIREQLRSLAFGESGPAPLPERPSE